MPNFLLTWNEDIVTLMMLQPFSMHLSRRKRSCLLTFLYFLLASLAYTYSGYTALQIM